MPARVVAAGTVFCLFATVCQVFIALLHQHFLMSLGAQETECNFLFVFGIKL